MAKHSASAEHGVTCSCPEGLPHSGEEAGVLYYNVVFHCKASSVAVVYRSVEIALKSRITSKLYTIYCTKYSIAKL